MKIYSIAVFVLMVNVCMSLVNSLGLVNAVLPTSNWASEDFSTKVPENLSYDSSSISFFMFGDFLRGLSTFFYIIKDAPTMSANILYIVGFPSLFVEAVRYFIWLVYVVGVVQFLSKYSIRNNA